jgi:deazaflavin-dependent oxidoreductase (nitroreductase family)
VNVLFLRTVGRKSGQRRESPVSWFADGDDAWLIVASAAGSAHNPDWYYNLMAHPDQVSVELPGRGPVAVVAARQLDGARRDEAWTRIVQAQPRYAKYQRKTDRVLPIIRLTPVVSE